MWNGDVQKKNKRPKATTHFPFSNLCLCIYVDVEKSIHRQTTNIFDGSISLPAMPCSRTSNMKTDFTARPATHHN
jgi:hypothetical protein